MSIHTCHQYLEGMSQVMAYWREIACITPEMVKPPTLIGR